MRGHAFFPRSVAAFLGKGGITWLVERVESLARTEEETSGCECPLGAEAFGAFFMFLRSEGRSVSRSIKGTGF